MRGPLKELALLASFLLAVHEHLSRIRVREGQVHSRELPAVALDEISHEDLATPVEDLLLLGLVGDDLRQWQIGPLGIGRWDRSRWHTRPA